MGWIVWDKMQPNFSFSEAELAFTSFEVKMRIFQYARGNESGFAPKVKNGMKQGLNIHSTQKPPRLIERLFALVVPKGQTDITVIDPFAGSMGCGVVCKDLNYNYIGCEIHSDYYKLGKGRLDKHQPNPSAQTLF